MKIIFDIEADGLLDTVTKVWCAVAYNVEEKTTMVFSDYDTKQAVDNMSGFLKLLDSADEIICHNLISYDLQVLKKLYNFEYQGNVLDTLLMSKLLKFNRRVPKGCRGAHGLEPWGIRTGIAKPSIDRWDEFNEEIVNRCIEDVKINVAVYNKLSEELRGQPASQKALDIEHKVAFVTAKQVAHGWLLDQDKVRDNITYLDTEIERLRATLEPQMPARVQPKEAAATWEEVNEELGDIWEKVPETRFDHRGRPLKPTRHVKHPRFLKDGRYTKDIATWFGFKQEDAWSERIVVGPFTRFEFKDVKLSQHAHVKAHLLSIGWIPTDFNIKRGEDGKFLRNGEGKLMLASPKLTKDSFDSIPGTFGEDFKRWATLVHRRTTLANPKDDTKGWLNLVRDDGHVACDPDTLGAATGRMVHRGIVNVPGVKSIFGTEMRSCWIAEPGRTLVGADAAGAQLRLLAAAMGDQAYLDIVINGEEEDDNGNFKGTDVHTQNGVAAGLLKESLLVWLREHDNTDPEWKFYHDEFIAGRAKSKTFIYALLFGAGNPKIGTVVGGGAAEGKRLRDSFLRGFPKLGALIKRLEREWESNKSNFGVGYINGLDGRRVYVDSSHKLLNYKLQGDEAIFIKYMMVLVDDLFAKNGVDANLLLVMHDEANYSVAPSHVDNAKIILSHAFIKTGEYLGLLCPMETAPLVGDNWAEIH